VHASARPTVTTVPLALWEPIHPLAAAFTEGTFTLPPAQGEEPVRSAALAGALALRNAALGNPVDEPLSRWQNGAEVVVTGQQPGLLGGPLLTLVKACAVAAHVRSLRAAGREAVGFVWLATADDDLPEMGWGRLAVGEDVVEVREASWRRGDCVGGVAQLGTACSQTLAGVQERLTAPLAREALALAGSCYAPGTALGLASARFLARLLRGLDLVLVDALEPELARASARFVERVLTQLPAVWETFAEAAHEIEANGWRAPLRIAPHQMPLFRLSDGSRHRVATSAGACPPELLSEFRATPERFVPNAWLRPLVQDAALGTTMAVLGGAELAYHVQAAGVWPHAGIRRPVWRLRPHVTVMTGAERRLGAQLKVAPERLLRAQPPVHTLPGARTRRRLVRLRAVIEARLAALAETARVELPALGGDVDATANKLGGGLAWLEGRMSAVAAGSAETEIGRWQRLRAFVRPGGQPQERALSVLAPLLRLGLDWPLLLTDALRLDENSMQLLFWEGEGLW
jgi:bacillithiol synthase